MRDPSSIDTAEYRVPPSDPRELGQKVSVSVDFGARTHVGLVRENNQDSYLISRMGRMFDVLNTSLLAEQIPPKPEDFAYTMVIADGMGGMAAGEKASLLAIRTGVQLVLESPKWSLSIDESEANQLIARLSEYFRKVDAAVIREVQADASLKGMGTTLTVIHSVGADVFLVHAGDSRAYLYRPGVLRQLTRDHIYPGRKNVLTNFVGVHGIEPEIATLRVQNGDRLLLCTDGLTNMVSDEQIAEILERHADPQEAAIKLVDRALEQGGKDNVTALVARYAFKEST